MIDHTCFGDQQAAAANRMLDYVDGKQLSYVTRALNGEEKGGYGVRYNWLARGFIPRMRNITKPIVEKSAGNLFAKAPKFNILPEDNPSATPVVDPRLNELLTIADFQDFGNNWNIYSRALRSVVIFQQKVIGAEASTVDGIYRFNPNNGDLLVLTLLHRGNTVVRMNATRTIITELAYLINGCPSDDEWQYRYINSDVDQTVTVKGGKEISREATFTDGNGVGLANQDGFVSAVMHYDTSKPRSGEWHHVPEDLPAMQEMVNSHLTDLEFALATQKGQSLYTDAEFRSSEDDEVQGTGLAGPAERVTPRPRKKEKKAITAGIGAVVQLKQGKDATKSPFISFLGPDVDLDAQQSVLTTLVNGLASDWSVNLKVGGSGSATSGFQLVVEELDNLNLREQRTISFTSSLRKMYNQLQRLYPELQRGQLQVEFTPPNLPVNQKEVEEIWTLKQASGRASAVDYFMVTEGLSRAEAILRAEQVKNDNQLPTVDENTLNNAQPL